MNIEVENSVVLEDAEFDSPEFCRNEFERPEREEIFSKTMRAGKRTYFFDVKATKGDDYYLTITESKKRLDKSGSKMIFEKHKIFLYKEHLEQFLSECSDVVDFFKSRNLCPTEEEKHESRQINEFTSIEFEDLDK